ncbi:MAG: hypothetical protein K6C32_00585 [Bacilli bacterium]|nr:hypothetical protein [Bacilli bacterium]
MKKRNLIGFGGLFILLPLISGCQNNSKSTFTITWKNYDGTVLETDNEVKKGAMPSYDGATPVKNSDASNLYYHTGWDPEVVEVKKDMVYTAQFASKSLSGLSEDPDGYEDVLPEKMSEGAIFHAFCWKFKDITNNLESIAAAGFKSVQTSPVQEPKGGGSSWWSYYQPVSFTVANNSGLGTKQDLIDLCTRAHELGVNVIADIVFNHLANVNDDTLESDGTPVVSPEVKNFEPYIYEHRNDASNPTFHHNKNASGSGAITQYYAYGALPDLNTGNEYVQERSLALLKECIDIGIDGFRFDAAKHIETPDDPDYPSDFWVNTLMAAKTYYKNKNNKDLFAYGEVLGEPGGNRKIEAYTKYMAVTDDGYIGKINTLSANKVAEANYTKDTDAANIVTWAESHDTYTTDKSHQTKQRLMKNYAVLASRSESRPLFLARPDDAFAVGKVADYTFEDEGVAALNHFHNRFVHVNDNMSSQGKTFINQKQDGNTVGAVIVNYDKNSSMVSVKLDKFASGIYYNQVDGSEVKVVDGYLTADSGEDGIIVLTKSKNDLLPRLDISSRGGSFAGSLDIQVSYKHALEATYSINGSAPQALTNNSKITIGDVVDDNNQVTLAIHLANGDKVVDREYVYSKIELIPGYFNVVNINPAYFTDYELYMWSWNPGKWSKDYTVQDDVVLVDTTNITVGFLFAIFPKGYTISNPNVWDSHCLKQTGDIKGATLQAGFYDASDF